LVVQKGKVVEEEEEEGAGRKMGSDSEFVTPGAASRKKRKLFSNTPQHSQVWLGTGSVLQYRGSREEDWQ
jgi:hypothetical protein